MLDKMLLLLEEIASSFAPAGLLATTFYDTLFLGHYTSNCAIYMTD
jgi:hypothetical protein